MSSGKFFGRLLQFGCFVILTGCGMLSMTQEVGIGPPRQKSAPTVASIFQTAPTVPPTEVPTRAPTAIIPTRTPTILAAEVMSDTNGLAATTPTLTLIIASPPVPVTASTNYTPSVVYKNDPQLLQCRAQVALRSASFCH